MVNEPEIAVPELDSLQEMESRFRTLVNKPRRHHKLFQREKDFISLCSAMDIIGDILLALWSYTKHPQNDQGLAYLQIFGVLQSLNVQQDATMKLHEIITGEQINLEETYPDIKEVRDLRIRVAGHPVGGKGDDHFLARYSVSSGGFEFWTYDKNGSPSTTKRVNLPELIKKHSSALGKVMSKLIALMEDEDRMHKEAFMGKSLAELFRYATYPSSKLFESVPGRNPRGAVDVGVIKKTLREFREALSDRSQHFLESGFFVHDIPMLDYALERFERYINGDTAQNERDAYILARFILVELENLAEIAKEIDDDYHSKGSIEST